MKKSHKLKIEICLMLVIFVFGTFVCFAQSETDVEKQENKAVESKFNLIVTDKNNDFITNLVKEDISIFIDGKEQTDFSLEKETAPLFYLLAMDNSGSMRQIIDNLKMSAKTIIEKNKAEDLTALMRFVDREKLQTTDKFSSDKDFLYKTLDSFQIEGGATALTDAIYNGVKLVANQKGVKDDYRRIFVVISDGEDRDSFYATEQLTKLLAENNVQIFFIGLINELDTKGGFADKSVKQKAKEFIEKVTEASGGVAVFPKNIKELPEISKQLSEIMRTQYIVKIPNFENLSGKKIEIKTAKTVKYKKIKFNYRVNSVK